MLQTTYIAAEIIDGVVVARVTREKIGDFEAAPLLGDLTTAAEPAGWKLVVDLREVQMLGSQGIGLFLTLRKRCDQNKGKLVLCGLSPEITEMLRISALLKLFVIKKDHDEALAAVK